jgi:hypothetical protein
MKKPSKCCEIGEHKCTVPMPIMGRSRDIDFCVADLVAALNAANIETTCSCCGHNEKPGVITLEDGRCLLIIDRSKLKFYETVV